MPKEAPTPFFDTVAPRKYLLPAEIELLMNHARKHSRYGHRDATMILITYRHGFRASEVCGLEWSMIELDQGKLHVRRRKNGSPSTHTLQGDEIRALRKLRRDNPNASHVFLTERDGPFTTVGFNKLISRLGAKAALPFAIHPHMLRHACGYALANAGHDTRALAHWLGHKNMSNTMIYTQLSADRFKNFWK